MKKLLLLLFLSFLGCTSNSVKEEKLDEANDYKDIPLTFKVPSNFPTPVYNFEVNPPTQKGFELGKKLFYDGRLSSDGTVSCGFCHEQSSAFTHHGHNLSHGVGGAIGTRNTPSIQNLAYQNSFMYDGATENLDLQAVIPLSNPNEMNANFTKIMAMLKADPTYQKLFKAAFANGQINAENMMKALGQFMVMVTSSNSKFDKFRRNEPGGNFSTDELEGYEVFKNKCASCHATDLLTDHSFRNNGLPVNPYLQDVGRYKITEKEVDKYKFKVPSLRNVAITAPYMHDGRFGNLKSVLDFYDRFVTSSPTLDPILKQNEKLGISLSDIEKQQLIAFLNTLTDSEYLNNKIYSE